jgi:hypothetical protein
MSEFLTKASYRRPNFAVELALLLRILEVPGLNLGPRFNYPDFEFL